MLQVRQLCVEHIVQHVEAANAPHMLKFSKVCNSPELKAAATKKILESFQDVVESSTGFFQLTVREVLDVFEAGPLKVGTEEVFADAVLQWLEVNFAGAIRASLEELEEMERRIADGIPALRRLGGVVAHLKSECDRLSAETAEMLLHIEETSGEIGALRKLIGELNHELSDVNFLHERYTAELSKIDNGRFVDAVYRGYRGPELKLQAVLEALSVLLGMEQHWSSARRIANEGGLIAMLVRYDVAEADPNKMAGLFKYAKSPILDPKRMPNKDCGVFCGWVQTAVLLIELLQKLAVNRDLLEETTTKLEGQRRRHMELVGELGDVTEQYKEAHANWIGIGEDDVLLRWV